MNSQLLFLSRILQFKMELWKQIIIMASFSQLFHFTPFPMAAKIRKKVGGLVML